MHIVDWIGGSTVFVVVVFLLLRLSYVVIISALDESGAPIPLVVGVFIITTPSVVVDSGRGVVSAIGSIGSRRPPCCRQ